MITTKQRSNLKALAHHLKPIMQIGKNALTETVVLQANENLFHNELIKIRVLNNCELTAKELIAPLAEKLFAEPVSAIGNVITLYKRSDKEGIEHIEF